MNHAKASMILRPASPGARRALLAGSIASVLGLAIVGMAIISAGDGGAASEPLAANAQVRVRWPMHERFGFSLEWKTHRSGEPDAELRGEIALERIGAPSVADEGLQRLALRYARLDSEQAAAELLGQVAYLDVSARGQITAIAFASGTSKAGELALRRLARQLGYTLPERGQSAWEADERGALGEARVHYRGGEAELAREVIRYAHAEGPAEGALERGTQRTHGIAVIALDADQLPLSIEESAQLELAGPDAASPEFESSAIFSLRRTSRGPGEEESARPAADDARPMQEPQARRESP